MPRQGFKLPENCLVRLLDLDTAVRGLTVIDDTGFANIYINARLSLDGQREALKHELRHYFREDMTSPKDIRTIEAAADRPTEARAIAMDGAPLDRRLPQGLRPVGRGAYQPEGALLARVLEDLARIETLLRRALQIFDIMQPPPGVPMPGITALCARDIAFLGFPPGRPSAALMLCREHALRGAVYYDESGLLDNALILLEPGETRIAVDLRRRRGTLDVWSIEREANGNYERIWGGTP